VIPRIERDPQAVEQDDPVYPCCGGFAGAFGEHRYRYPNRVWPATATPEVRRLAVRGDCIAPANAQITDLFGKDLDYAGRRRLTEILASIWGDGHDWGTAHAGDGRG
jgi:hypothetical protein